MQKSFTESYELLKEDITLGLKSLIPDLSALYSEQNDFPFFRRFVLTSALSSHHHKPKTTNYALFIQDHHFGTTMRSAH